MLIKSKPFAVPQYPTETLLMAQTRRATGTAALMGMILTGLLIATLAVLGVYTESPLEGTAECEAARASFELFQKSIDAVEVSSKDQCWRVR